MAETVPTVYNRKFRHCLHSSLPISMSIPYIPPPPPPPPDPFEDDPFPDWDFPDTTSDSSNSGGSNGGYWWLSLVFIFGIPAAIGIAIFLWYMFTGIAGCIRWKSQIKRQAAEQRRREAEERKEQRQEDLKYENYP